MYSRNVERLPWPRYSRPQTRSPKPDTVGVSNVSSSRSFFVIQERLPNHFGTTGATNKKWAYAHLNGRSRHLPDVLSSVKKPLKRGFFSLVAGAGFEPTTFGL